MTGFALWVEWMIYWAVVASLYSLKDPAQITAFVSITQHFQWTVATILLAYLGVQTAENFSSTAANSIANVVQNAASYTKSDSRHTEVIIDETAKNQNLRADKEEM